MTPAQLEKKLNAKLNAWNDQYHNDLTTVEEQVQHMQSELYKIKLVLVKDIRKVATSVKNEQVAIEAIRIALEELNEREHEVEEGFPIGFVYVEMPYQVPPQSLWSGFKWKDISSEYSGLFLRAAGGGSAPFGAVQPSNHSWISDLVSVAYNYDSWTGPHNNGTNHVHSNMANWSSKEIKHPGLKYSCYLYNTLAENRPTNMAVRFWQRVV